MPSDKISMINNGPLVENAKPALFLCFIQIVSGFIHRW